MNSMTDVLTGITDTFAEVDTLIGLYQQMITPTGDVPVSQSDIDAAKASLDSEKAKLDAAIAALKPAP